MQQKHSNSQVNPDIIEQGNFLNFVQLPIQAVTTQSLNRKRSTALNFYKNSTQKWQYSKMIQLKQQLLAVRQRKSNIPLVPDPQIVNIFKNIKQLKQKKQEKNKLLEIIQQKKKQLSKLKHLYSKSQLQFQQKSQIFRQKSSLLRVLSNKTTSQLTKTKDQFRQAQFNKMIVQSIQRILYFRLCQIFFNKNSSILFSPINYAKTNEQKIQDEDLGNCLGYLTLFMNVVGQISGGRLWINFIFKGPLSTLKISQKLTIVLHPKDNRLNEGLKYLNEQLYQIMRDTLQLKIQNPQNFYLLCQQLTKQFISNK